jgi:Zn-dependent protease
MRWSIRLGRLFGVPVNLHLTFLALLVFVGILGLFRGGPTAAFGGVTLIAAVFGCVLLHEFGHVLAARRYGIPTHDVTLLPIGGLARLARMPDEPKQELVVALAGPAVNVAIAALLLPLITLLGSAFLVQLFAINVVLAVFNMLPAFPMDGGRVLRALLARRMSYVRATDLAATIGKGMAVLLAFAGAFGIPGIWGSNPMLLVIAWFVWSGAGREAAMVRQRRPAGWSAGPRSADEIHEAEIVWSPPSNQWTPTRTCEDVKRNP